MAWAPPEVESESWTPPEATEWSPPEVAQQTATTTTPSPSPESAIDDFQQKSADQMMSPRITEPSQKNLLAMEQEQVASETTPLTAKVASKVASGLEKGMTMPERTIRGALDFLGFYGALDATLGTGSKYQDYNRGWLEYFNKRDKQLTKEDADLGATGFGYDVAEGVARAATELPTQLLGGAAGAARGAAVKGAALTAGAIGGLSQYAQDRGSGKDKTESAIYGGVSGAITGLTTAAFGATGVESIFKNEGVRGVSSRILNVLKQAGLEGAEESVDQFQQDLLERTAREPNKPISESVREILLAGSVGSLIGGAASSLAELGGVAPETPSVNAQPPKETAPPPEPSLETPATGVKQLSDADLKRNYAEYVAKILDYGARGEQVPKDVQAIAGDLVDEINRRGIEITTPDQGKRQRPSPGGGISTKSAADQARQAQANRKMQEEFAKEVEAVEDLRAVTPSETERLMFLRTQERRESLTKEQRKELSDLEAKEAAIKAEERKAFEAQRESRIAAEKEQEERDITLAAMEANPDLSLQAESVAKSPEKVAALDASLAKSRTEMDAILERSKKLPEESKERDALNDAYDSALAQMTWNQRLRDMVRVHQEKPPTPTTAAPSQAEAQWNAQHPEISYQRALELEGVTDYPRIDTAFFNFEKLTPEEQVLTIKRAEAELASQKQEVKRQYNLGKQSVASLKGTDFQGKGMTEHKAALRTQKMFQERLERLKSTAKPATPTTIATPGPATEAKPAESTLDKTTQFINKGLSGQVGESQLGGGLGGVSATFKSKAITQDIPEKALDLSSTDPKVEARWQAAKLSKKSLFEKGKDALVRAKNAMTRHFPKLDPKQDGAVSNILRVHEGTPLVSQYMASNALRGITSDLGPRKYGVFERIVILRDLIAYGEKFLTENKELPFGYGSIDAMRTDLAKFEGISKEFPDITEAVRRRDEFINALRDDLVDRNLLPEEVKDFKAYFHHQVLEHMAMKESVTPGTSATDVRTHRKGWQRKRVGSSKDFNTSYLESEFEVISQSFAQMMTQDTLKRVEAVADISQSLKDAAAEAKLGGRDVDWRSLVPKDYTLWQPTKGNHFYWAQSLTEKALESFLRGEKELTAADFNEILALGGPRKQWVIPKRLAETLDNFGPQKDHAIERFIGMGMAQWKRWTLFNPMRNLIYEANNFSGDVDIAFAVDPKIFSHARKAKSELSDFVLGKKAATPQLDYLIKQGVVDSGFSVHELPDLKGQQFFRVLSGQEPGMIQKYWDTVLDFNRWREGILRYAAYERALERLNTGEKIYWTSKKAEIDGMRQDPNVTNQEIAAKLAREAIGDYGNISHAGQWIRSKAIPFYSWMEINAPRYIRLFQNVKNEPGAQVRTAAMAGKRVAVGTAMTAARAAALYLLANIWNKTLFPDEEDELGLNQKQLHVILGRREDGSIISLRLQGALSDALGWFGAENVIKDVQDVMQDRASIGDKAIESAKAPVNRVAGGSFPIQKTLIEATLGRQTFPDVFDPRQVRDPGKHIARLFSVGTVYDYLTKKPQRPGTWSPLSLVTYATDPGEAAYYASKSIVSDWLAENGKDRPETLANDKANALYYHKQAIKYKDQKLAELWKQRYMAMGGTTKGMKASMAKLKPTSGVAKKDESKFKSSLSPAEKQILDRAEKWYKATY